MKKLNLTIIYLFAFILPNLYGQQNYPCIMDSNFAANSTVGSGNRDVLHSGNGTALPLVGEIRVLLLFAEVDCGGGGCSTGQSCYGEQPDVWPAHQLPYAKDTWFDANYTPGVDPVNYLTKYYYDMSMGNYIVLGDYYPEVITVPCTDFTSRYDAHNVAIDILNDKILSAGSFTTQNGFSYSDFDSWGNEANGEAKTNSSNNVIDVTVIVWRNLADFSCCACGWGVQDLMNNNIQGYGVKVAGSFNGCDGGKGAQDFFIAEYFHALFGGNNFHSTSGAGNHSFLAQANVFSMTAQAGSVSNMACGWDRWFLDWKNPNKQYLTSAINESNVEIDTENFNISSFPNGGTYILRDFATTGDAIRVKLPHINWAVDGDIKNQYIWLENHQISNEFDKFYTNQCSDSKGGNYVGGTPGLYSYLQVGKDIKEGGNEIYTTSNSAPNGLGSWLFPISAEGNYDFKYRYDLEQDNVGNFGCKWNGASIPIDRDQSIENPLTGYSDLFLRIDYNKDGVIAIGGADNVQPGLSEVLPSGASCTNSAGIQDGNVCHNWFTNGDWEDAFGNATGNIEMSLSSNPPAVPRYTYAREKNNFYNSYVDGGQPSGIPKWENRTIWLNGLSIKIIGENVDGNGAIKVQIKWDKYEVDRDVRWCGNIALSPNDFDPTPSDHTDNMYALNLLSGKSITIDRGNSPTQHIAYETINGKYVFSEPTTFTCLPNSYFHMENNSQVSLINGSTMRLQAGSKLEIHEGAKFYVGEGSKLIIEDGANLSIHNGGLLYVLDGGEVIYSNATAQTPVQIGNNYDNGLLGEIRIEGKLTILESSKFEIAGRGFIHFVDNGIIQLQGFNSEMNIVGINKNTKAIQVSTKGLIKGNTDFNNIKKVTFKNCKIVVDANSELNIEKVSLATTGVLAEGGSINGSYGFVGENLSYAHFNQSEFKNLYAAIKLSNLEPEATAMVVSSVFNGCRRDVEVENATQFTVLNSTFNANSSQFAASFTNVNKAVVSNSKIYEYDTGIKTSDSKAVYLTNDTKISFCGNGIYGERSEVYLRTGASVESCVYNGVELYGSATVDDAMLTVGDVGCGSIINNSVGVKGKNFLFDIDAIDHNNGKTIGLRPNRFDGNETIFDVCYTGAVYETPVRARGNVWETNGTISTAPNPSKFMVSSYCPKPNQTKITVDFQDFSKCVPTNSCEDCSNKPIKLNEHQLKAVDALMSAYVKCEEKVKLQESKLIGSEYNLAKEEFVVVDEEMTRNKYKEVSRINLEKRGDKWIGCHEEDMLANRCGDTKRERILPDKCVHLIRVAQVIADKSTGSSQFKKGEDETTETTDFTVIEEESEHISIYPNPNSGRFVVETTDIGTIKIYDFLGKNIYNKPATSTITIIEFEEALRGIYLLEFIDSYGVSSKQRFISN